MTWLVIATQVWFPLVPGLQAADLPLPSFEKISSQIDRMASMADRFISTPSPTSATVQSTSFSLDFSDAPGDQEFMEKRVLAQPLVAMGGATTAQENRELARALTSYRASSNRTDFSHIERFLDAHPKSAWRVSLLANLGLMYRNSGYFSRALETWEEAWKLGRSEKDRTATAIVDYGVGQLAQLNSRLGRYDRLEKLFEEINGRPVTGSATENIAGAKEGLWVMNTEPWRAFLCGPAALTKIHGCLNPGKSVPKVIQSARSTRDGTSLIQLKEWAQKAGMDYQVARRNRGAKALLPSVVHWNAGHFAALVEEKSGKFHISDPTFGNDLWISPGALDAESSGYFLVPAGPLPEGWESVTDEVAGTVWGKGISNNGDPRETRPCDTKCGGDQGDCHGMPRYSVHALLVSLNIMDTPVSYSPPRGLPLDFTITYNERDAGQSVFNYSNMGSKWTFNWLAYITDLKSGTSDVDYYTSGGGYETYGNFNSGTGAFDTQLKTRSKLMKTGASSYELTFADGSKQIFGYSDAAAVDRKIFLTGSVDPQGNSLTYVYTGLKLTRVDNRTNPSDANSCTAYATIDYVSGSSRISKVTITVNVSGGGSRAASFGYDSLNRLAWIVDSVGLTSSFQYDQFNADNITALTTPYGTTKFSRDLVGPDTGAPDRWLTITDPLGGMERVVYKIATTSTQLPGQEPSTVVPSSTDMDTLNGFLEYRNSFFWSKKAMKEMANPASPADADYAKAHLYHWLHSDVSDQAAGILESEKQPLERRVWYNYNGQANATSLPTGANARSRPSKVGRVMADGTTQLYQFEYNDFGRVTKVTQPTYEDDAAGQVNRQTAFIYAANGLDLLEARQTTGGMTPGELLAQYTYVSGGKHLVETATDAAGQTTQFQYNSEGQIRYITNPKSEVTEFRYAANGFLEKIIAPAVSGLTEADRTTTFTPDNCLRVATATDGEGYVVSFAYDNMDRATKITYNGVTTDYEQIVYSKLDPVLTRDRLGRWSAAEYDALRHLVAVKDALGRITTLDWCTCGSLNSLTDALGQTTSWERDLQGRVTRKTFPDASSVTYKYEGTGSGASFVGISGRLLEMTDAKGQTTRYSYYGDESLKSVAYVGGAIPTHGVSFTYDAKYNRPKTMTDGVGTTTYGYKAITTTATLGAGRLETIDGPLGNDTITFSYDELGRIASRDIDGTAMTMTYDALGRVGSVVNALGTFGYTYKVASARLDTISYPSATGLSTVMSYLNNAGHQRLQTIWNKKGANTVSKFDYDYFADGKIKTWTQQADSSAATFYDFGYDSADQLVKASLSNGTPGSPGSLIKKYGYSYDPAGNRTSESISSPATATTAQFNNLNQLAKRTPGESFPVTGTAPDNSGGSGLKSVTINGVPATLSGNTYSGEATVSADANVVSVLALDNNGNSKTNRYQISSITTSGTQLTQLYDLNGNLIKSTTGTSGNDYKTHEWDAANRLVAIDRIVSGSLAGRSEFTYDGLGRRVRIIEKDASGSVTSDKRFLWCEAELCEERNAAGSGVNKRYFAQGMKEGSSSYYYTRDHLGSIREMLDSNGTVRARYDYDPYGRRTKVSGDLEADFGFAGYYFHVSTGFSFALFRCYDPDTGRWLSRDPIGILGGLNLYGFVSNNPINLRDLLGLSDDNRPPIVVFPDGRAKYGPPRPEPSIKRCGGYPDWMPHSGGLYGNGAITVEPIAVGGHAEANLGFGAFSGGGSGPRFGGYFSYGASAGPLGIASPQNPSNGMNFNPGMGLYGGLGAGIWLSNAKCPSDLAKTEWTISVNGDYFGQLLGLSVSYGNGIWQFGWQPPGWGVGWGIDVTAQKTTTKPIGK